jgi:NADH dehydrogenase
VGGVRIRGALAWLLWLGLHLAYLTGGSNRVTAALHWGLAFGSRRRAHRTVLWQAGLRAGPASGAARRTVGTP